MRRAALRPLPRTLALSVSAQESRGRAKSVGFNTGVECKYQRLPALAATGFACCFYCHGRSAGAFVHHASGICGRPEQVWPTAYPCRSMPKPTPSSSPGYSVQTLSGCRCFAKQGQGRLQFEVPLGFAPGRQQLVLPVGATRRAVSSAEVKYTAGEGRRNATLLARSARLAQAEA